MNSPGQGDRRDERTGRHQAAARFPPIHWNRTNQTFFERGSKTVVNACRQNPRLKIGFKGTRERGCDGHAKECKKIISGGMGLSIGEQFLDVERPAPMPIKHDIRTGLQNQPDRRIDSHSGVERAPLLEREHRSNPGADIRLELAELHEMIEDRNRNEAWRD
jgi:hypothetical protein